MKIDYTIHGYSGDIAGNTCNDQRVVLQGVKAINYVRKLHEIKPYGPWTGTYLNLGITVHSITV